MPWFATSTPLTKSPSYVPRVLASSGETVMETETCFCRSYIGWKCFPQEVGLDQAEIWIEILRNRGNSFGRDIKVWLDVCSLLSGTQESGVLGGIHLEKVGRVKLGDVRTLNARGWMPSGSLQHF